MEYLKDPQAIYRQSFETIETEAALQHLNEQERQLAVRCIHACGMIDLVDDLKFSDGAAAIGADALKAGAPIITDVEMVAAGIIKDRLPSNNLILCGLREAGLDARVSRLSSTKSAAGIDLLRTSLRGAVVVIGNAPTALFRLLELLDEGAPRPALILAFPVGFVGAEESKQALHEQSYGIPYVTLLGRRGGSAIAAAAVNALAA